MSNYRILRSDEQAFKNMVAVAKMLEALSPNGIRYEVGVCYLDYGQDWKWSCIIAQDPSGDGVCDSWQAINPREWGEIEVASSAEELARIVNGIFADKYCPDRVKEGK